MPWRDNFELENIQEIIEQALSKFKNSSDAQTNSVKQKRINKLFVEASQNTQGIVNLSSQEKHLYSTVDQASHFVTVSTKPDFSGLDNLLSSHKDKFKSTQELIDYGCGNAIKSSWIYYLLNELCPIPEKRTLHLFDYNDVILTIANDVTNNLGITSVNLEDTLDIEDHHIKRKNKNSRLHFFLGQTIGNFKYPRPVIENLAKSMRKGEYLVVEWLDRDPAEYEKGTIGERNLEFLYRYFEEFGIPREHLSTNNGHFMRNEKNSKGDWNEGYLILNNEFTHNSGITLEPGTNLVGLRSRRFRENELPNIFEQYGLEAIVFEKDTETIEMGRGIRWITHERKYESDGDKRYAILKKVKEPISRLKIAGVGLLGTIAAAALSFVVGSYYFGEKVIECDQVTINNFDIVDSSFDPTIICKNDNQTISLSLEQTNLKEPTFTPIDQNRVVIESKGQSYSVKIDPFIEDKVIPLYHLKQKYELLLEHIKSNPTNVPKIDFSNSFEESILKNIFQIASCTKDLSLLLNTHLLLDTYNNDGLNETANLISYILAQKACIASPEKTTKIINYFKQSSVINQLRNKDNQDLQKVVKGYEPEIAQTLSCVLDASILFQLEHIIKDYDKATQLTPILKIISTETCINPDLSKVTPLIEYFSSPTVIKLLKDAEIKSKDYFIDYNEVVETIYSFFKDYSPDECGGLVNISSFYLNNLEWSYFKNSIFDNLTEIKAIPICNQIKCYSHDLMMESIIKVVDKYKDFEGLETLMDTIKSEFRSRINNPRFSILSNVSPQLFLNNCVSKSIREKYTARSPIKTEFDNLMNYIFELSQSEFIDSYEPVFSTEGFAYATGICSPQDYKKLATEITNYLSWKNKNGSQDWIDGEPFGGMINDQNIFFHEIMKLKQKSQLSNNFKTITTYDYFRIKDQKREVNLQNEVDALKNKDYILFNEFLNKLK